jgi:hypothetical protein
MLPTVLQRIRAAILGIGIGIAIGLGPGAARAEPAPAVAVSTSGESNESTESSADARGGWLVLGSGYMHGLTDASIGGGPGVVAVDNVSFIELAVSPQYPVAADVALGPRLSYGIERGDHGQSPSDDSVVFDRQLWQVGVTGRYQPAPRSGPYLGVGSGAAAMVDSFGDLSATQWGLSVEALAGLDLRLASRFALGLELRVVHAVFSDASRRIGTGDEGAVVQYGPTTWLALNLVGNVAL